MLSKKTLCGLSTFFQHACYMKLIPFDWEPKTFKLIVPRNYRVLTTILIFCYNVLNTAHLFVAYFIFRKSMSVSTQAFHIFWATCCFISTVNACNALTERHEIATFVNHFLSHQKLSQGNKLFQHYQLISLVLVSIMGRVVRMKCSRTRDF